MNFIGRFLPHKVLYKLLFCLLDLSPPDGQFLVEDRQLIFIHLFGFFQVLSFQHRPEHIRDSPPRIAEFQYVFSGLLRTFQAHIVPMLFGVFWIERTVYLELEIIEPAQLTKRSWSICTSSIGLSPFASPGNTGATGTGAGIFFIVIAGFLFG